jgi:hypothetical protein
MVGFLCIKRPTTVILVIGKKFEKEKELRNS